MNKIYKIILIIFLCTISVITISSCSYAYDTQECVISDEKVNESIDNLVQLALIESDIRLEDYVDIDYFSNLQHSTTEMVNQIQTLSYSLENNSENIVNIDDEQYDALTNGITGIFADLNSEEYEVFKTLAEDDVEIAEMINMIENGFYEEELNSLSSSNYKAKNVINLSTALLTIGSLLSKQQVCNAAIIAIKGAFNSMVATLKAFFVPNTVKCAIITAAILVITTVVIVNWNKIKPVFNQIINIFISNAKGLADNVAKVFNQIKNIAFTSESTTITNAVFNDEIKSKMGKYGLIKSMISSLIKQFTNVDINNKNNSNNKTVYLGCTEDFYYNIAEKNNGISFHVADNIWESYVAKYGYDGLWLVNYAFINYVIYKRWEIVLVTNPALHYNLYTQTKITTRMYASELELLCKYNGAKWHYEGPYWRVDKAW